MYLRWYVADFARRCCCFVDRRSCSRIAYVAPTMLLAVVWFALFVVSLAIGKVLTCLVVCACASGLFSFDNEWYVVCCRCCD